MPRPPRACPRVLRAWLGFDAPVFMTFQLATATANHRISAIARRPAFLRARNLPLDVRYGRKVALARQKRKSILFRSAVIYRHLRAAQSTTPFWLAKAL